MEAITAVEYLRRRWRLEELAEKVAARLPAVDVMIGPTVPITPPILDAVAAPEAYQRTNMLALRNTAPANLLRFCGLSMPVALDKAGLPVGLQLMAPLGEDDRLLAVGLAFERVLGTARQRLGTPPLGI
jgi:aspartyl-tRNA(Asn)/glutamyl-tRNA(Gln) amidotransferase subunit A